jgi:predicted DNA-binding protein
METTSLKKKRKNIDLPTETFTKLSILASAQGKSLKAYIENILISKADSLKVEISPNPSPSGDPWFDDPENLAMVKRGLEDIERGDSQVFTIKGIEKLLGV